MTAFLAEYGMFLLKVMTIVVAVVIIIGSASAASRKAAQEGLEVENINKKYRNLASALRKAVLNKAEQKKVAKEEKQRDKAEAKDTSQRPRTFVIDFKGDLKASAVPSLRASQGPSQTRNGSVSAPVSPSAARLKRSS